MVSAWTCDWLSWFQSTIVFTKNELLNCSVWAVGTKKHLVMLFVSCWTTFEEIWEVLRLNVSFVCFLRDGRMFQWGGLG